MSLTWWIVSVALLPAISCQEGCVAFYATRSSTAIGPEDPLTFDDVAINEGGGFSGNMFTAPVSGYYLMSLSGAVMDGEGIEMNFQGLGFTAGIYSENTNTNGVSTRSRTLVVELEQDSEVSIQTATSVYSDSGRQVSWGGFLLASSANAQSLNTSAFYAYRDSTLSSNWFPVPFNHVPVNVGGGWESSDDAYLAYKNLTVFMSYSTGLVSGQQCQLSHWLEDYHNCQIYRTDRTTNGIDIASKSTMIELPWNEFSWIQLEGQTELHSDPQHHQTSIAGFAYDPSFSKVAWSAHRVTSLNVREDPFIAEFPVVTTNQGNVLSGDRVTIPVSGYYFLAIDIGVNYLNDFERVDVDVIDQDGDILANVLNTSVLHNGTGHTSRSVLVHLNAGDVVQVRANQNSGIFSDVDSQSTFTGFLVYPDSTCA